MESIVEDTVPREKAAQNEDSIHDDTKIRSEDTPAPIGNRLGGNGWSGWSSQFEQTEELNDDGEEEDLKTPTPVEEIKSFDSLLQLYGNNTSTQLGKMDSQTDGGFDSVDGASNASSQLKKEVTQHKQKYNNKQQCLCLVFLILLEYIVSLIQHERHRRLSFFLPFLPVVLRKISI